MHLLLEILAVGCGTASPTTLSPCRETCSSVRCQSPVRDALSLPCLESFTCSGSVSVPSHLFVVQLPRDVKGGQKTDHAESTRLQYNLYRTHYTVGNPGGAGSPTGVSRTGSALPAACNPRSVSPAFRGYAHPGTATGRAPVQTPTYGTHPLGAGRPCLSQPGLPGSGHRWAEVMLISCASCSLTKAANPSMPRRSSRVIRSRTRLPI